ncbi:MAG TPA: thioredoxin [Planctomycetota bacterium]|nr:thioredoxin [Planctomycetota bacterium]
MSEKTLTLTDQNWETEAMRSAVPVFVDFWAPWCAPCRAMGPSVDRLAAEFVERLKGGKMNTSENTEVPIRYGVTSIPTFLVLKGGQVVETIVGSRSYNDLKTLVQKHLG